jgi:ketosteroid isomerase-like protein
VTEDPVVVVMALYAAYTRGDVDAVLSLIHPRAAMRTFATAEVEIRGTDRIRDVLVRALDAPSGARIERFEALDGITVLAVGSVRSDPSVALGDGRGRRAWLYTVEDRLVRAIEAFDDENAAREIWRLRSPVVDHLGATVRSEGSAIVNGAGLLATSSVECDGCGRLLVEHAAFEIRESDGALLVRSPSAG